MHQSPAERHHLGRAAAGRRNDVHQPHAFCFIGSDTLSTRQQKQGILALDQVGKPSGASPPCGHPHAGLCKLDLGGAARHAEVAGCDHLCTTAHSKPFDVGDGDAGCAVQQGQSVLHEDTHQVSHGWCVQFFPDGVQVSTSAKRPLTSFKYDTHAILVDVHEIINYGVKLNHHLPRKSIFPFWVAQCDAVDGLFDALERDLSLTDILQLLDCSVQFWL
mmetsp:Transcript_47173/g.118815  ORF Transcript_47173/g.118815 Transcript_47173/m.118815 type:complete len:218 (+) Transcript_47173:2658-3311(+)